MIEKIVLDHINSKGVAAFMEEQAKMPGEYVLIEKIGSSEKNFVNDSSIAIQSLSTTLYKTAALNEKVKELMHEIVVLDDVISCNLNSDYNYPDPEQKRYRYQALYDIKHY